MTVSNLAIFLIIGVWHNLRYRILFPALLLLAYLSLLFYLFHISLLLHMSHPCTLEDAKDYFVSAPSPLPQASIQCKGKQ